jgi:hypothetical protein
MSTAVVGAGDPPAGSIVTAAALKPPPAGTLKACTRA